MTLTYVTTATTAQITMNVGDQVVITTTGSIASSMLGLRTPVAPVASTVAALYASVYGSIYSANTAIYFGGTNNGTLTGLGLHTVLVGEEGVISSLGAAVDIFGSGNRFDNAGEIDGRWSGVSIGGHDSMILNSGSIYSGGGNAMSLNGWNNPGVATVVNSGQISGHNNGISANNLTVIMENRGDILGLYNGIEMATADASIYLDLTNSGTVRGQNYAVLGAAGDDKILNTGAIYGDIDLVGGHDQLTNSGLLVGEILLGDGWDTVRNSGDVQGAIALGNGDDLFNGLGGSVRDYVDGGQGDDTFFVDDSDVVVHGGLGHDVVYTRASFTAASGVEEIVMQGVGDFSITGDGMAEVITGNTGSNVLAGEAGNDTISGRGGDDMLLGGNGDDILRADSGNDRASGGAGADTLSGGIGDDTLEGQADNDILNGNHGADILIGGLGTDVMTGGGGADVFQFDDVAESTNGAGADKIRGFLSGVDVVDLSGINDDAFTFLGTGAFTGGGDMELRYDVNGFGHALVYLDENGDGTADGRIVMWYTDSLSAADFIL